MTSLPKYATPKERAEYERLRKSVYPLIAGGHIMDWQVEPNLTSHSEARFMVTFRFNPANPTPFSIIKKLPVGRYIYVVVLSSLPQTQTQ